MPSRAGLRLTRRMQVGRLSSARPTLVGGLSLIHWMELGRLLADDTTVQQQIWIPASDVHQKRMSIRVWVRRSIYAADACFH